MVEGQVKIEIEIEKNFAEAVLIMIQDELEKFYIKSCRYLDFLSNDT